MKPFAYSPKPCRTCGKTFDPVGANSRYCSLECQRGTSICEECGKEFINSRHTVKRFCSTECFYENTSPVGSIHILNDGYAIVKMPKEYKGRGGVGSWKRWHRQHVVVMEEFLGRQLEKHEQVHHINCNRADNRLENLELWSGSHPAGFRVMDEVKTMIMEMTPAQREELKHWLGRI